MARVTLRRTELQAIVGTQVDQHMKTVATVVKNVAKKYAPVKTGRLRDSIQLRRSGDRLNFSYNITIVNVPYGGYVVDGTRPHVIVPHRAKVLRMTETDVVRGVSAEIVTFGAYARHPGTEPNDFLDRALQAALVELRRVTRG